MVEVSSVKINASGTYSDYFQISETGATIFQGSVNPTTISVLPAPKTGDLYICTSIPELFIYDGSAWTPIGESTATFNSQEITVTDTIMGNGVNSGTLYAGVNISTPSTLILPVPISTGTIAIINDESGLAGTNPITISAQDLSNIDGQSSVNIDINGGSYTFLYSGSNWSIISAVSSFPLNQMKLGDGAAYGYTISTVAPSYINNYEIQQYIPGTIEIGQILSAISIVDYLEFPQNFVGSVANCLILPQFDVVINITINNNYIGTLSYYPTSSTGYFQTAAQISANPGDMIIFSVATSDPNISGIFFTLDGSSTYSAIVFDYDQSEIYYSGTPFTISGASYPAFSYIQVGYSTSNTVPPTVWTTILIAQKSWNATLTIPTNGIFYIWAQIPNTDIVAILDITTISLPANSVAITNSNSIYYIDTPFYITGTAFPDTTNLQIGYSVSNTIPPSELASFTSSNGFFEVNVTIQDTGSYYVWVQQTDDATINSIYAITILAESITITNSDAQAYYVNTPFSVSGTVSPNNDATVQIGYSTSNTIAPSTFVTTNTTTGSWNANLTIPIEGNFYIWAQLADTNDYSTLAITTTMILSPTVVQSVMTFATGEGTFDATPTVGNWLVALAASWDSTSAINNWLQAVTPTVSLQDMSEFSNDYVGIAYYQVVSGDSAGPYTPMDTGTDGTCLVIYELSGVGSTFTIDQIDFAGDQTTSGSATVGNAAVSALPNTLQLGLLIGQQGATVIPQFDNTWTSDQESGPVSVGDDGEMTANAGHRVIQTVGSSLDANINYVSTESGFIFLSLNIAIAS